MAGAWKVQRGLIGGKIREKEGSRTGDLGRPCLKSESVSRVQIRAIQGCSMGDDMGGSVIRFVSCKALSGTWRVD